MTKRHFVLGSLCELDTERLLHGLRGSRQPDRALGDTGLNHVQSVLVSEGLDLRKVCGIGAKSLRILLAAHGLTAALRLGEHSRVFRGLGCRFPGTDSNRYFKALLWINFTKAFGAFCRGLLAAGDDGTTAT